MVTDTIGIDHLPGLRVLELGSGTGALGIALALIGAHVTVTDLTDVLPMIVQTAHRNGILDADIGKSVPTPAGGSLIIDALTWGERIDTVVDIVLGCELLYWGGWDILQPDTHPLLLTTIQSLWSNKDSNNPSVFLSTVLRDRYRERHFFQEAVKAGIDVEYARQRSWEEGELIIAILRR